MGEDSTEPEKQTTRVSCTPRTLVAFVLTAGYELPRGLGFGQTSTISMEHWKAFRMATERRL